MAAKEKEHALFGASSAHRWLNCPGCISLEKDLKDKPSAAAEEGTTAHKLADVKIMNYFNTLEIGKRKMNTIIKNLKKEPTWDDEMMGYTDEYLDYAKAEAMKLHFEPKVYTEKRLYYRECMPKGYEDEGFGTADCVMISSEVLHILDFKYGKSPNGRVSAVKNPQMMLYALGAYETYRLLYKIDSVQFTIVQPRLPDGVSEWECNMEELFEFREYVKERAALAVSDNPEFHPSTDNCRFCRAKGLCRARAEENVKLAFAVGKKPPLISNEEMGNYLLQGQDVAKWLSDLQETALSECLAGREVPGWKAVEGRAVRNWTDMDLAFDKLTKTGIAEEAVLYEKKPLTLAQVEKLLGKKDFVEAVGEFVAKSTGKPTLTKESDKRDAITNKISAAEAFKEDI